MKLWTFVAIVIIYVLGGASCGPAVGAEEGPGPSSSPWTERLVCEVPKDAEGSILVSTRGDHWCCRVKKEGGETVVGDGNYSPQRLS